MAFTNLAVFGGAFFTPIVVGRITHDIMWWWTFYLVAIFCGLCLPLVILFCPETAYVRDPRFNTDMLATEATAPYNKEGPPQGGTADRIYAGDEERRVENGNGHGNDHGHAEAPPPPPIYQKTTFLQSLMPFNGRKTNENFFKLLLRPFPLFLHPAFIWASLIQGTLIGWTVFIGVIMAQFFLGYPLWWDEVNTGYAYTGAFIGALLGFAIAGLLSDWSAGWLTRRNGGIYEPEFRILLVIPQLIFGCLGLYGFGITLDGLLQRKFHWVVPVMFFGLEVCGMVIGAVASSLYIVDAYRGLPFLDCPRRPSTLLTWADRRPHHRRLYLPHHFQELLQLRPDVQSVRLAAGERHPGDARLQYPRLGAVGRLPIEHSHVYVPISPRLGGTS